MQSEPCVEEEEHGIAITMMESVTLSNSVIDDVGRDASKKFEVLKKG